MTTAVTALLCYILPYAALIFNLCTLSSLREFVAPPFCDWIHQGKPLHIQTPLKNAQRSNPLTLDVIQHIPEAIRTIDGDYSKLYKTVKQTTRKCKDSNLWGRRECKALILPLHPYCNWSAGQKLQCQPAYLSILLTASPWTKALVPALGQIHPVIFPAWELGFLTGNTEARTEKPEHKCNCVFMLLVAGGHQHNLWLKGPGQYSKKDLFQSLTYQLRLFPELACTSHNHTLRECTGWRSQDLFLHVIFSKASFWTSCTANLLQHSLRTLLSEKRDHFTHIHRNK